MKVTFFDRDGKGRLLGDALEDAGHELVSAGGDVALVDTDLPLPPYDGICASHDRVIVYPHGGGYPMVGPEWPVHPNTVCRLVPGTGQADVLALCGYPVPVAVIGWPYSQRLPFRPCPDPVDVLFAPHHQDGDGWLLDVCRESNGRIHDLLAGLPINLTVRYPRIRDYGVEDIGITRQPGVTYQQVPMDVDAGIAAAIRADVVVASEGTYPSLAIALGTPTVMTCQVQPDYRGDLGTIDAISWDLYREMVRYPHDADTVRDPEELMQLLRDAGTSEAADWRDRFVGDPFDPAAFVKTFEAVA